MCAIVLNYVCHEHNVSDGEGSCAPPSAATLDALMHGSLPSVTRVRVAHV
jgi:hypothetical protein